MVKIEKDRVVSLTYTLRRNGHEGDVVETVTEENPLTFIYGTGNLLPKFEENLLDLGAGDDFQFMLPSVEAYGEINPHAVVQVPLKAFEVNGEIDESMLSLGNTIPMMDSQGRRLTGTVKEVGSESVTMDFNHPLAGQDLYFTGSVYHVREASEEELSQKGGCGCGGSCDCGPEDEGCGCGDEHGHGGGGCSDGSCGCGH